MSYFEHRRSLKRRIQFYYEIEQEQKKFIQLYNEHINLAKENQCFQLLINARILLDQTLYIYNSVKADQKELEDEMKLLID